MIYKIKEFIKEENLLPTNKVVLGFSYGIDSRALLDILLKLHYEVILVFINHHIRKESDFEEQKALELAEKLHLKIYIKELHLGNINVENEARKERYQFFKEVANKEHTTYIATAHHKNDNAETIIMNILRGSNLYGYAGIAPSYTEAGYTIIRPLLCVSKDEIKAYQEMEGFEYFEDATNQTDDYKRNRIRHHIIPSLIDENPNALDKMLEYSKILKSSFDFIREKTISYLNFHHDKIELESYKELNEALRLDILCYLLEKYHVSKNYDKLRQMDQMILNDKANSSYKISNNLYLIKSYKEVKIDEKSLNFTQSFYLDLDNDVFFENNHIYFSKNEPPKGAKFIKLCYNDLVLPLIVRNRKNGDTIELKFGHKKLKDLFIDKKIPLDKRDTLAIIENNHKIIWVVDYAKSYPTTLQKESGDIYLVCEVQ